ncbi:7944_t:CDS:2 [Funneliformis geosporum]|nr:7944_t:CDS:2 [Funneliformis geosporum]
MAMRFRIQDLNRNFFIRINRPQQLPPECLVAVFELLENDISALYSCIRVNRHWCRLAVPVLWRRPFEHVYPEVYGSRAINTYINCLSKDDKQRLISSYVVMPSQQVQPIFYYPKFLQGFDCDNFISSVRAWLPGDPEPELIQLTARLIGNMIFRRSRGLKNLRYLRKEVPDDMTLVDFLTYTEVIRALTRLQRFEFRSSHVADRDFTRAWLNLFAKASASAKNLRHITVHIKKKNRDSYLELDHSITDLIGVQKCVQSISVNSFWSTSNSQLIYQAMLQHSRSLNYLRIQGLSDLPLLFQVLRSCRNLKTLEFAQSWIKDDNFTIIPSKHTLSIQHLYYYFDYGPLDFINALLQMSSHNLKSFTSKQFTPLIITTIRDYCPNIKHLCIRLIPSDFALFEQLLNTLQLEHLTIQTPYNQPRFTHEQIIRLALTLPESCTYLGLDFDIYPNELDVFLSRCKAKLKILALHNITKSYHRYLEVITRHANCLREVRLQRNSSNISLTEYQYKKALNGLKHRYANNLLKISEAKPISFSYHARDRKLIDYVNRDRDLFKKQCYINFFCTLCQDPRERGYRRIRYNRHEDYDNDDDTDSEFHNGAVDQYTEHLNRVEIIPECLRLS